MLQCVGKSGDSQSASDSVAVSDSALQGGNSNNDKYICGFTGSFTYSDNIPLPVALSSSNDSAIERSFSNIWINVIGGRPDAIRIEKDADQNNTEYKYAAAKGSFTDLGNIVRYVFYKSSDISPLLNRDNGWILRAIALHEFAHHINGDPFTSPSRDLAEVGADDYAGFMMSRWYGTTLDTALLAFSNLTEEHPTNGYPNRQRRLEAVKAGWKRGQISELNSLVSAFLKVKGISRGFAMTDSQIDYRTLQNAIDKNGQLETVKDTSTIDMAKVKIEASSSPGEFLVDSNYLYFKARDTKSIVGRVALSNRPEYRQMVYDNFYNYMYIDSNNALITYIKDYQDPKRGLKLIVIGRLSEQRHR